MELNANSRVLVVAAHPDDEVLGAAGTLMRAIDAGAQVFVSFLGEGVSARFPFGQYDSPEFHEQTKTRMEGAHKALAFMGIPESNISFGKRLCGQFDTIPLISMVKEIESTIEAFRPTILLTHTSSEVNVDHRRTFEAVEVACRPTRSWGPNAIYTFEIICSSNWTFESHFKPNVFVDISKYWERKLQAWHFYEGESRPFPFPRNDTGLETLSRYRGMAAGLEKAEAFRLVREIHR